MDNPDYARHLTQLGRLSSVPASPDQARLEAVPNPHPGTLYAVRFAAPEFTALCPVTGQPDLYVAVIEYWPEALCLESKALKLYLNGWRNEAHFCEALTIKIHEDVARVLELPPDKVRVTLTQKARGGISITATS